MVVLNNYVIVVVLSWVNSSMFVKEKKKKKEKNLLTKFVERDNICYAGLMEDKSKQKNFIIISVK